MLSPATRAIQLDPVLDFGLFLVHRRRKKGYEETAEEDFVSFEANVPMPGGSGPETEVGIWYAVVEIEDLREKEEKGEGWEDSPRTGRI